MTLLTLNKETLKKIDHHKKWVENLTVQLDHISALFNTLISTHLWW